MLRLCEWRFQKRATVAREQSRAILSIAVRSEKITVTRSEKFTVAHEKFLECDDAIVLLAQFS